MTHEDITAAVAQLRKTCGLFVEPPLRGPAPLNRFFEAANLNHTALAPLNCETVAKYLVAERYISSLEALGDFPEGKEPLDGFLFWSGSDGLAFVKADDILPRRRFTAAHELGHAILHRESMGQYLADASIAEGADASDDPKEREANRFAVELLMPEEVLQARAEEFQMEHGCCPRSVLAYRLAAELLVSQQAITYRLRNLEIGDE